MAGVLAVVLVVGGLAWSATSGRPAAAQRPSIFGGSLVLEDTRPLTVIDVATAQITVRLEGVNAQVGATNDGGVQPVAVTGGTVLVNRTTGTFNFLEADDYVTDPNGPGVGLGALAGSTAAQGFASGPDAYIVRAGPAATVSLVGQQTVAEAAKAQGSPGASRAVTAAPTAAVSPIGFSSLRSPVSLDPGSVTVSGPDLWLLEGAGPGCSVVRLHPDATSRQGLVPSTRSKTAAPCRRDAVESDRGAVGVATPGQVQVMPAAGPVQRVATPFTAAATRLLPVTGAQGQLWFLADGERGWELFGVDPLDRVQGPYRLSGLGARADPVVPALSRGFLYTLDQDQTGQPTLWTIDVANGHMAPLGGTPDYPLLSKSEKDSFHGAQIVAVGPRVVINNPQSLEAVVVFTDGTRLPVVVDKSQAVSVSTTGPADLSAKTPTTKPGSKAGKGQTPAEKSAVPVVQPVSQQVTCANTTQKPYAPQVTGVTPSSGSALIQWSYQLLDQTDCEPSSWSVQVKALTGGHQPASPVRVVYGQNQYLFTGLRPTTTYQVVVTAYINHQSTPSTPATFTTSARGPDAPLSVQTRADGRGDWVVSWTPCTEATNPNCVVPADQWTVTGAACAGSFVGTPPSVQVAGSQDSVTINAAALSMLGDSLSFSVQGRLASGLTGNPTGDHACTEAYQKPDPSAITVTGQGSAAPDGTITATITVAAQAGSSAPFGVPANQAEFVYTLAGGSGAQTVGPVNRTSEVLTGLPPGVSLTPSVEVYPAGHPDAAVTVTGKPFQQTLPWPDLSATSASGAVDPKDPNQGSVTVTFPPDLPAGPLSATAPISANSPGAGPEIQCGGPGGAVLPFPVQPVSSSHQLVFPMTDLVDEGGSCTVSLSLSDGANPNPYGGPSPDMTIPFTIGTQPDYSFVYSIPGCGNYQCGPLGKHYTVDVDAQTHPFQFQGGGDWSVIVRDTAFPQALDPCYTNQGLGTPPSFPYSFELPGKCLFSGSVTVTVGATYLGQANTYQAAATNTPGPPATTTTTSSTSTTSTTTTSTTTSSSSTTAAGASPARANPVAQQAVGWSFAGVAAAWPVGRRRWSRTRRKSRKADR